VLRSSRPRRLLATVLFTDIVGSTALAEQLGDARWRRLLADHHQLIRRLLRRHRGREVDTAGDGFFATFSQPADAIACAIEAADAVARLDIQIRAGIHTGEVEPMGAKVGGIGVHIGARILGVAEPGQLLVSSTVHDLVTGGEFTFSDAGTRILKGVAGEWRLWSVVRPSREPEPDIAPEPRGTSAS
jgi:class 3 adenylate cyclase